MIKNTSSGKTPEIVVKLLKEAVARKGQSAVARESGIALYSVQRYLKGMGYPTEATLQKLSSYFGLPVFQLRSEEELIDDIVEKSFVPIAFYQYLAETFEDHLNEALKYDNYHDNKEFIDAVLGMADVISYGYREFFDQGSITDLESIKQMADAVIDKFITQSTFYTRTGTGTLTHAKPYDAETVKKKVYRELERMKTRPPAYRGSDDKAKP